MPALLIIVGAPIAVFEHELNPYVRGILLSLFTVAWFACWVGGVATWFALNRFRCPQCGRRFIQSWWNNWPTNRCKHCGLDLGPAAMASAKPVAEVDLWE
jgi:hypothetical protein